jgi:hypothetical protein
MAKAVKAAHVKGLVNRVNAKRAAIEEAEKAGGNAKKARRGDGHARRRKRRRRMNWKPASEMQ